MKTLIFFFLFFSLNVIVFFVFSLPIPQISFCSFLLSYGVHSKIIKNNHIFFKVAVFSFFLLPT